MKQTEIVHILSLLKTSLECLLYFFINWNLCSMSYYGYKVIICGLVWGLGGAGVYKQRRKFAKWINGPKFDLFLSDLSYADLLFSLLFCTFFNRFYLALRSIEKSVSSYVTVCVSLCREEGFTGFTVQ